MNISICIPSYNEEDYIERAIHAACNQQNTEVFVIDDCSTDSTFNIANKLTTVYSNLYLFQHNEKSDNWQQAMSFFFHKFNGRHIHITAADDFVMAGFSESCSNYLESPVIFHNFAVVDSDKNVDHVVHMGYPHVLSLTKAQVEDRIKSQWMATETGVASTLRKDCLQWLVDLRYWELKQWSDAIGYAAVAAKFGATFVPLIGAGFTKFHKNGKNSYGHGCADDPILVQKISVVAKDFLRRAGLEDHIARNIMLKRNLLVDQL